jgi:hypothetical protein
MKNPVDPLLKLWETYDPNHDKAQMRHYLLEAQQEVEKLKRRMFLEGFKNSGEGFNGEHPTMDEEKIWEIIKEDYDKLC